MYADSTPTITEYRNQSTRLVAMDPWPLGITVITITGPFFSFSWYSGFFISAIDEGRGRK